jgi:hypothetical protein
MDWRHLYALITASRDLGLALKNLVVWAKDNAAMGAAVASATSLTATSYRWMSVLKDPS